MRRFFPSAVLFLVLGALPVSAHPHVFINDKVTVTFDAGTLQGIGFTWTFDDMFSNMILSDYDPNHTGHFSAAQAKALKEGAFDNLENYHYFVALAIGNKPVEPLQDRAIHSQRDGHEQARVFLFHSVEASRSADGPDGPTDGV